MQVNIAFSNAKIYNIERFDVIIGEKFTLLTDHTGPSKWFSDNDPVLTLDVKGNNADLQAASLGESTILIMDENLGVIKKLAIKVVQEIVEPAADLGINSEVPESK